MRHLIISTVFGISCLVSCIVAAVIIEEDNMAAKEINTVDLVKGKEKSITDNAIKH